MKQTQNAIYLPPVLPDYLKNVYDLKPIIGPLNDDEMNGIQAVIRAAQNTAQIPGMFNPELSMTLTQHLFKVQMARYQEKYSCGMFPDDMVHTPPTLRSHLMFTLESVVGVPSDKELQAVQAAARGYEQMSIFPSMFDPTISMELSQHLFNIQLAQYMHNVPRAEVGEKLNGSGTTLPPSKTQQPLDIASELPKETPEASNEPNAGDLPTTHQAAPPPRTECNHQLTKISDTRDNIKLALIRAQQNDAQASG